MKKPVPAPPSPGDYLKGLKKCHYSIEFPCAFVAPEADQKKVRKTGILIAIVLRIVLLFVLVSIIDFFQEPFSFLTAEIKDVLKFAFNGHSIIVLIGGGSKSFLITYLNFRRDSLNSSLVQKSLCSLTLFS
jgi:predicted tellurium resistance membrane protein TerC